jgi:hypothetical protein
MVKITDLHFRENFRKIFAKISAIFVKKFRKNENKCLRK